jgi:hypothetical protein
VLEEQAERPSTETGPSEPIDASSLVPAADQALAAASAEAVRVTPRISSPANGSSSGA